MESAPIPENEKHRINRLKLYRILDTPPEEAFDRVTRIVAETIGVPIALISLIDGERQWFKSKYGLETACTSRDVGFCTYTILTDRVLEIGTGSGYHAAVLSRLAREVCTVEIVPELAASAAKRLSDLGYRNVIVRQGDGYQGWAALLQYETLVEASSTPSERAALGSRHSFVGIDGPVWGAQDRQERRRQCRSGVPIGKAPGRPPPGRLCPVAPGGASSSSARRSQS